MNNPELIDECRKDFEAFVRRGTYEGEDFLERHVNGEYVLNATIAGWAAWQGSKLYYAPKMTEAEAVSKAIDAIRQASMSEHNGVWDCLPNRISEKYAKAAFYATGIKFKEEDNG